MKTSGRPGAPFNRAVALTFLAAIVGCAPAPATEGAAADTAAICAQIFSTNDMHGRLLPAEYAWSGGRPVGGSAALAAYAREADAEAPECPLFIVSGGDIMQGTLVSNLADGASTIAALNAIGYDAAAIGNHEFDWGVEILRERIAQADFPLLGANIYERATGEHPPWVRPWAIVEKDGVRVGFIGATTRSTPTSTRPTNVVDFEFRSIAAALDRYIPEVREAGADFVVAVMHEGGFCNDDGCDGEALEELAATTERFDYAVTGHTHSPLETEIRGTPVVQSYSYSTAFGLGRLDRDAGGAVRARLVGIRRTYVDEVTPDPDVQSLVQGFAAEVADVVGRVVTEFAEPIAKPRRGDLVLGRLIADAQRAATGTQVALMNAGGVRRAMPAGEITYADLFELQPFGNRLVTLSLSGARLLDAFEHGLADGDPDAQLSGVRVTYDAGAQRGARIVHAELVDGTPIEPESTYTVTVNDFMSIGGSGYTMFLDADDVVDTGIVDVEALVEYLDGRRRPAPIPGDSRWIPAGRDPR
ncbi:MAG: 5'-nucleotidase C-terminal domain-containing protein [Gemmatimonadota bacterium]|nr:5'-nucleotidase C-terminal domain-containing protein [Gemmatimonadota bacterium]